MHTRWVCSVVWIVLLLSALPAAPAVAAPSSAQVKAGQVIAGERVAPADTAGLAPAGEVGQAANAQQAWSEGLGGRILPRAAGQAAPVGAGPDPLQQAAAGLAAMPAPALSFEGMASRDGVLPPDTDGAVGPNHFVQMVNLSAAVFDKQGRLLHGPFHPSDLWPVNDPCRLHNDGDPVVLYDRLADRWLLSQFSLPNYPAGPYYECIAVSKTGTPTNLPGDWWPYSFRVSDTKMNDYPKLAVWPDGYYMTVNQFTNADAWGGVGVFALDRAKMLQGQIAGFQYLDLSTVNSAFAGMLPADLDGPTPPPAGSPAYFFEVDGQVLSPSLGADALRMWKFHVDWSDPGKSTFGLAGQPDVTLPVAGWTPLPCAAADTRTCISQKGSQQKLDAVADRLMFRVAYRNFGNHESVVLNHTVLADGADRAGIRWYEVRNPSSLPVLYQQGTFAPADGNYRWMGSAAMDHVGNLALGYSVAGPSLYPSIRYSGRLATDPLGALGQGETEVIAGGGAQTHSSARWGDYSAMSIDPADDCTFWYTQEYTQATTAAGWQTRVAAFKFPNCSPGAKGLLEGAVKNAATGAAISGATVTARSGVTLTAATTSAGSGAYSLSLPIGTYTATAAAYGYMPVTATPAAIFNGASTRRDFSLQPALAYRVTGKVADAAAGWPLYARISISNYPGEAVWTDPVSGQYSVDLMAGTPYTFTVETFAGGYQARAVAVGPLTGSQTVDISLAVDAAACSAAGYLANAGGLFEPFESSTFPPSGWTVENMGGQCTWAGNDPGGRGNLTGGAGRFAIADSDYCGPGTTMYTYLLSPAIDVSMLSSVNLSFNYDFFHFTTNDHAVVDASADGGKSWTTLFTWTDDRRGPAVYSQDLTSLLRGSRQARLRFHYEGANDYWWQVDNILLGQPACRPQAGGLVVGSVSDANTGATLAGAKVTSDAGSVTTTVDNPSDGQARGFYSLFVPSDSHVLTATRQLYGAHRLDVTVPLSGTVRQNFSLDSGRLSYSPPAVNQVLADAGQVVTVPVTVKNTGQLAATYSLLNLSDGVVPLGPFQQPNWVVKPFRHDFSSARGLGVPSPPAMPAYAGGAVLRSWPTGLKQAWGIVFDGRTQSVWVSSPGANWNGTAAIYAFGPKGEPRGSHAFPWSPLNGPADAAFNWNTGRMWLMNVGAGADNCIYEIDPAQGPTGRAICPGGPGGFAVSQRGLAYDPAGDTWFAGSWNDAMIHRFAADGTMLADVNVGIAVAGLAYNPRTRHLFVVDSPDAGDSKVYVLDVANQYAPVGQFTVPGLGGGGAGLEIGCDGHLWLASQGNQTVYEVDSGETVGPCGDTTVPWMSETPMTGTVPAGGSQVVQLTLDSSGLLPGIYRAQVALAHDTPYVVPNLPVTLTLNVPATWGLLNGTVRGLGYCDQHPAPLPGAHVLIQGSHGMTWTLPTGQDGGYRQWIDQSQSPVSVTVDLAGYLPGRAGGVAITGGVTTTQDLDLRWQQPCVSANPPGAAVRLMLGKAETVPFTITNRGALSTTFSLSSLGRGFTPRRPAAAAATNEPAVASRPVLALAAESPPAPTSNGSRRELPQGSVTLTQSTSQAVLPRNTVTCHYSTGPHADNHYLRVFDPSQYGITNGFRVSNVAVGIESATAAVGTTSQPAEVRLYMLDGPLSWANLTLVGKTQVQIPNQALSIFDVPVSGLIPAGARMVVDFFTPNGLEAGNALTAGSNNLGQTAPTYLAAPGCGIVEPTALDSIGLPNVHLVMSVSGSEEAAIPTAWLTLNPAAGTVNADGRQRINLGFDSAVVGETGVYSGVVQVKTGDPQWPVVNVPVTMTVGTTPVCHFTNDSPTLLGSPTRFTNSSSHATSYQWDFGDRTPASRAVNPVHTYASGGRYTVTLAASSEWGVDVCAATVVVEAAPAPGFTANSPVRVGQAVMFVNTTPEAIPPVTIWRWDFGDGTSSSEATPVHAYSVAGSYTVKLTATNARGTATYTAVVAVRQQIYLPFVRRSG